MAKHAKNNLEILSARISLVFFNCLLMGLLLYAERFARYRYDYVFRRMLPWLMPLLIFIAAAVFAVLLFRYYRGKKQAESRIFTIPFILYLLVAPLMALIFPYLVLTGVGLNVFKLVTFLVFCAYLDYFTAFVVYYTLNPALSALCWLITADCVAFCYYFELYFSASAPIMNAPEYHYLSPKACMPVVTGILLTVYLIWLTGCRFSRFRVFRLSWYIPAVPLALTACALAVLAFFSLSSVVKTALYYGTLGAMVLWFIMICVIKKKK